jgi:phosphatidate cytidylyltransferase
VLRTRILTALVLLAILLPALFANVVWPFAAVMGIGIVAAAWEWARLNGAGAASIALGVVVALACAAAFRAGWSAAAPGLLWWLALAAWVLGGAAVLRGGTGAWPAVPRVLRGVIGAVLLVVAWLAFTNARSIGINFLLSVFCLVWMADVAAYFGGRAFGKRKLAPSISPGKSWEGVWSGMIGALLLGVLWVFGLDRWFDIDSKSLFAIAWQQLGIAGFGLVIVFLAAMSVVGDLFESLIKRAAGAKDSSGLLPGHGGVLDRIDALLPVFPIALAIASLH